MSPLRGDPSWAWSSLTPASLSLSCIWKQSAYQQHCILWGPGRGVD